MLEHFIHLDYAQLAIGSFALVYNIVHYCKLFVHHKPKIYDLVN